MNRPPAADGLTGSLFSLLLFLFVASVLVTCCSLWRLTRMAGAHAMFAGSWLRRRAWWGALPVLVLLATPVAAQEAPAEERETYPVVAAVWCTVHDGDRSEEDVGCDLGPGLPLYRYGKLSWVAVLGQETVGTGIAWVPHRPERGPIPAVAIGVVAPYDSRGIDGSDLQLAIGATLAFTGSGE